MTRTARKLTAFEMFSAINDERAKHGYSPLSQYEFTDRGALPVIPPPVLRKEFVRVMLNAQHSICSW